FGEGRGRDESEDRKAEDPRSESYVSGEAPASRHRVLLSSEGSSHSKFFDTFLDDAEVSPFPPAATPTPRRAPRHPGRSHDAGPRGVVPLPGPAAGEGPGASGSPPAAPVARTSSGATRPARSA